MNSWKMRKFGILGPYKIVHRVYGSDQAWTNVKPMKMYLTFGLLN